jgi:hypothetical protein
MLKRYAISIAFLSLICLTELAHAVQGRLLVMVNVIELCQIPSLVNVRGAQRSYACAATAMNQLKANPISQPIFTVIVDDLNSTVTYSF